MNQRWIGVNQRNRVWIDLEAEKSRFYAWKGLQNAKIEDFTK